jgi:hypothetical protein
MRGGLHFRLHEQFTNIVGVVIQGFQVEFLQVCLSSVEAISVFETEMFRKKVEGQAEEDVVADSSSKLIPYRATHFGVRDLGSEVAPEPASRYVIHNNKEYV